MFEVLMYLNSYYFGIFSIWEFITYMIKLALRNQTYHSDIIIRESLVYLLFCLTEIFRIYFGRKSDTSDKPVFMIISIILVFPSCGCVVYLLFEQICIIRLEKMLCGFQLVLLSCELFFGLIHLFTYRKDKY